MNTGNISQMGGCWVLVAGFGKEWILWVMQDFCVCGLHSSTTLTSRSVSLLLSSSSEQFFQAITSPCLLRREPPCPAPRGVPGSWLHTAPGPTQKKSVLTLVWRGCSCVSQSKCLTSGSTQCRMHVSLFLLLPWWISVGMVIQFHIQASHQ